MNSYYGYSRTPKDYSFAPIAAATASQGIGEVVDFIDKEKKRKLEAEELAQLKVDVKSIDEARIQRIAEAATEYMEAAGLPDTDDGRARAADVAASTYYPVTGSERKDPSSAAVRINNLDATWDKILNKARMQRYRDETASKKVSVQGGAAGQPQGNVGVEDAGTYRTTTSPTSKGDYVQQAGEQALSEPRTQASIDRNVGSQEAYDIARTIYGPEMPQSVQGDIAMRGKQEVVGGEYGAGTTANTIQRENLQKPIPTEAGTSFAGTFQKEPTALETANLTKTNLENEWYPNKTQAEINRMNAGATRQRGGGGTGGQQTSYLNNLIDNRKGYSDAIVKLNGMIADRMTKPEQIPNLEKEVKKLEKAVSVLDGKIESEQKRLNLESGIPSEQGPSEQASKVSNWIRESLKKRPPKGLVAGEDFGEDTYTSPDGKSNNDVYNYAMSEQVARFAQSKLAQSKGSSKITADDVYKELKNSSLEDIIDAIISASKGNRQ
jgi:hypothetical protein